MVDTKWQPGDPSASLLLTSEKAVFCKNDNDQKFNIYWSWWNPQIRNELCPCAHRHVRGILVHGQKRTQDDWLSSREPPLWLHGQSPNIFLASHITHAVPTLCVMVDFAPINELPKSFVEVLNCIALVSVREGIRFLLNELASNYVEAVKKGQEIQFVAGNCSHTVARNPTGVGRLVQGSGEQRCHHGSVFGRERWVSWSDFGGKVVPPLGWWDGGRTVGEFVQQAQHVARHSGPSGAPHLLCTSKILLSTIILLAIHIYQPHSEFYTSYTLQCRLYIERACYLRQPQSAS